MKPWRWHRIGFIHNTRLAIQQVADSFDAGVYSSDGVPLLDQSPCRLEHVLDQHDKEEQRSNTQYVLVPQPQTHPDHGRRGERFDNFDHPTELRLKTCRLQRRIHAPLAACGKAVLLMLRAAVGLDDANRGEHFLSR